MGGMTLAAFVAEVDALKARAAEHGHNIVAKVDYGTEDFSMGRWTGHILVKDGATFKSMGGAGCVITRTPDELVAGLRAVVESLPHRWSAADVAATLGLPICAWCDEAPATHDSHDDHYAPLGSRPERVCEPCLERERERDRQVERAMEG